MDPVLQSYKDNQSPRLKGYSMTRSRSKRERQADRLANGAPPRVCKTPECFTILSVYNDDDVCSSCYDAIPLNQRPYKYRAL